MQTKILKLTLLYYSFIVLCGCCDGHYTYVSYTEIETEFLGEGRFVISGKDEQRTRSEDAQSNGLLASLSKFKSANATQPCPHYLYFDKTIIDYKVTSNMSFNDSIPSGESLNGIFNTSFAHDGRVEDEYYLGQLFLREVDTINDFRDMYFEFELSNGEVQLDTVFNIQLGQVVGF